MGFGALDALTLVTSSAGLPVAQQGTWTVGVNGDALTALQLIDDVVRSEDEASAGGHAGAVVLARRTDSPANQSGTDGDYEFLQMSAGRLWTNAVVAGDVAHDAADGSGGPVKVGGVASAAAPTSVSVDGDRVNAWFLRNGAQATVVTAAGALIGGDATNGLDVDVTRVSGTVTVDGSGVTQPVSHAALTELAAAINASSQMDVNIAASNATVTVDLGANNDVTVTNATAANLKAEVVGTGTFVTQVNGDALTALQLIDNIVLVEDAAASGGESGIMPLAVRKDSAGTLASADGDFTPLQVDASGSLRVTGGGGGTEYTEDAAAAADPVGTSLILIRKDTPAAITSADGDNVAMRGSDYGAAYVTLVDNAGSFVSVGGGTQYDEDSAHVSGDKVTMAGVVRADTAAAQSGTDGDRTVLITDASGRLHVNVGNTVTVGSHAVTNAGTFATQVDGAALTSLQLIDNIVLAEDAAHNTADPGVQMLAVRKATPANVSDTDGDYEPLQVSAGRLWASATIDAALPAGTNAIGKLAANSGVDIGDVDVTSISAGTNAIGNVGLIGRASGGMSIFKSIDLDETEEDIKTSAGQVFSISAFNRTAAPLYLKFYNATAANVTVGTTTPVLTFVVPANADSDGAGFIWNNEIGFAFGTAISAAVTTGVADNDTGAPGANDCVVMVGYV